MAGTLANGRNPLKEPGPDMRIVPKWEGLQMMADSALG